MLFFFWLVCYALWDPIFAVKTDMFKVRLETFASLKSKKRHQGKKDCKNRVVTLLMNWCLSWEDSSQKDVIFDLPAFLYALTHSQ